MVDEYTIEEGSEAEVVEEEVQVDENEEVILPAQKVPMTTKVIRGELVQKEYDLEKAEAYRLSHQVTEAQIAAGEYVLLKTLGEFSEAAGITTASLLKFTGKDRGVLPPLTEILRTYFYGRKRAYLADACTQGVEDMLEALKVTGEEKAAKRAAAEVAKAAREAARLAKAAEEAANPKVEGEKPAKKSRKKAGAVAATPADKVDLSDLPGGVSMADETFDWTSLIEGEAELTDNQI